MMKSGQTETVMESENKAPRIQWATKADVAAHLKCSLRTINNLMRRRILPYVKIGKMVRFQLQDCDHAMARLRRKSILD